MQNQKPIRQADDISLAQVRQLINAIELLKDLLEKERTAKLPMMSYNTDNYYREICYSFGVRL